MSRQSVGESLAIQLYAAETAIDQALIASATLAAALPAARTEAWVSAVTGQRAFETAAAAVCALAEARAQTVRTHHTLSALARTLGLEPLAVGPLDKPGDSPPIGGGGGDAPGVNPAAAENVVNKTLPGAVELC